MSPSTTGTLFGLLISVVAVAAAFGCSEDPLVAPDAPATREECLSRATFGPLAQSPYCLPYAEGESYTLSQSYCSPPPGSHRTRFAYDFEMPIGTEIRAARAGVVVELREHWPDTDRTGGHENMVSLRHEDNSISLYLHMRHEGVLVEMGERVPQGGLLGWSGNTGDPQGIPHLHFQICLRGGICSYPNEVTLPVNFSNTDGALDAAGGLVQGETYTAEACGGP